MENKLSKGGDLRIKSPQLYHPATPVNQAPSLTPLHIASGDRSENRSAVRAETGIALRGECTCAERDYGLCPACACQALSCPNVSIFRVVGPTGKALRLCNSCTDDAREIGEAFGETIEIERLAVQS